MKRFYFISLFPQTLSPWLETSILGKAKSAGIFDYEILQLRDFSESKHRNVDDAAYGGGGGMVLRVEPLAKAVESIWQKQGGRENCLTVYFSPSGTPLKQELVNSLHKEHDTFIFVCGHYEGVDERFLEGWIDLQVSLGDFVITGGELPALSLADAIIRQCDGALGCQSASQTESFQLKSQEGKPLLEYPHYTRPPEYRGRKVPEVLLGGNHPEIARWRLEQATNKTRQSRPDLFKP